MTLVCDVSRQRREPEKPSPMSGMRSGGTNGNVVVGMFINISIGRKKKRCSGRKERLPARFGVAAYHCRPKRCLPRNTLRAPANEVNTCLSVYFTPSPQSLVNLHQIVRPEAPFFIVFSAGDSSVPLSFLVRFFFVPHPPLAAAPTRAH
uniref:Uncharacterized protein n=1 Tax=Steinernema glaseri TaxID=37863 RepID=A0A1I7YCK0_9BILA